MPNPTIKLLQKEISELSRDYNALSKYCAEIEDNLQTQKENLRYKKQKIESYRDTIGIIELIGKK